MGIFINHLKKSINGDEKLWKIVLFWGFLGNIVWAQEVYILYRVSPENQVFFVPHYVQLIMMHLYIPFSAFLLWKNAKNSSQINFIMARTGCAMLVVVFIYAMVLQYTKTHSGPQIEIMSFKDLKFDPSKNKDMGNAMKEMDVDDVEKLFENSFGPRDD